MKRYILILFTLMCFGSGAWAHDYTTFSVTFTVQKSAAFSEGRETLKVFSGKIALTTDDNSYCAIHLDDGTSLDCTKYYNGDMRHFGFTLNQASAKRAFGIPYTFYTGTPLWNDSAGQQAEDNQFDSSDDTRQAYHLLIQIQ